MMDRDTVLYGLVQSILVYNLRKKKPQRIMHLNHVELQNKTNNILKSFWIDIQYQKIDMNDNTWSLYS